MKVLRLFLVLIFFISMGQALRSQDSAAEARKRMTERTGGGTGLIAPTGKQTQVTMSYITYVSPLREWESSDGRKMHGRLVAFTAPKPGEKGPVEVIKEGKVRFARSGTKTPLEFPLAKLSDQDQEYARQIAAAAKKLGSPENAAKAE